MVTEAEVPRDPPKCRGKNKEIKAPHIVCSSFFKSWGFGLDLKIPFRKPKLIGSLLSMTSWLGST